MDILPVIILIVVAAVAGYFLGLLDSRLTHSLFDTIKKLKDNSQVLKVTQGPDGLRFTLHDHSLEVDPRLTAEERATLAEIISQLGGRIGDGEFGAASQGLSKDSKAAPSNAVANMPSSLTMADSPTASLAAGVVASSGKRPQTLLEMINQELERRSVDIGMSNCRVRLGSRPDLSVYYDVGSERYDEIDLIPDEYIRGLIDQTLKEWGAAKG